MTSLLIIVVVSMAIISAAIALIDQSITATSGLNESTQVQTLAESGLEEGLLKILRNPNFVGETLTTSDGVATITVSTGTTFTVVSKAVVGDHLQTVSANVGFSGGIMIVNRWKPQ